METMLQFFEWNLPDDSQLWNQVKEAAQGLREAGFTKVWLPPAYKGQAGRTDTGYGVYDMYDLGNSMRREPSRQSTVPARNTWMR